MAKKNSEYWKERFEQIEQSANQQGVQCYADIEKQYRQAQRNLEGQIYTWYQRFANNNGVTIQEARKMLTSKELEEFKWSVYDYIGYGKENAIDGVWMKQLENASARYHISRLEALKIQTQQSLEVMFGNQLDSIDSAIRNIYKNGYYHTAFEIQKGSGVGWDFATLDEKQITKVINKPWAADGKNFSERVWKENRPRLVKELDTELTRNILLGQDPQKAIDAIAQKMRTSKNAVGKLVMTEEAFFNSAAQKDCFDELSVQQFVVVATLDEGTCGYCGEMDGEHFPISQYEVGITAPPFHPWCRCTTAPFFEDDFGVLGERVARDADGKTYYVPADMKYQEWKETFVDGNDKEGLKDITSDDIIKQGDRYAPLQLESNEADTLDSYISQLDGNEQEKWVGAFSNTEYEIIENGVSRYLPDDKVYLRRYETAGVAIHETAHAIDKGSVNKTVRVGTDKHGLDIGIDSASLNIQVLRDGAKGSDLDNIARIIGAKIEDDWFAEDDFEVSQKYNIWAKSIVDKYGQTGFGSVSDIISGITEDYIGSSRSYGGHETGYWLTKVPDGEAYMVNVEAWADFCTLKVSRNENMLLVLKETVPGMYGALEQTYKEVFK